MIAVMYVKGKTTDIVTWLKNLENLVGEKAGIIFQPEYTYLITSDKNYLIFESLGMRSNLILQYKV